MVVEKVKSNFGLVLQNCSDLNERMKMFHFHSTFSCDEIIGFLKHYNPCFDDENSNQQNTLLSSSSQETIDVHFTIISFETLQRQRLKRKWLKSSLNDVKNDVKNLLFSEGLILDVKNTRYEIIVRNKFSPRNDVKTMCFNSKKPFLTIFEDIKDKIKSLPVEENIFSFKDNNLITHYVIIKCAGTKERRKKPSKSFSIHMPDYSSREIIDMVVGETKCKQNT